MGKIVRGAKLTEEAYVVVVPEVSRQPQRRVSKELDDRFAAPHDALAFDDAEDLFSEEEPLGAEIAHHHPQIDFEQVRADARALIDSARSDAEKMLRDAAARAKQQVETAQAHVAQIEAQARARGEEEGFAAGRTAGRAELAEQIDAIVELVENVREQRKIVIEDAEPELVRLAMAIAERIVHEQIAVDPNVIVENVRQALTRLVGREVVTLRVNPGDLDTIRQYRDSLAGSNDVEHLRVVEDQRVDRGGVVIETESGTIDAKVSTQLREARRTLQNGDTIAVSQAS